MHQGFDFTAVTTVTESRQSRPQHHAAYPGSVGCRAAAEHILIPIAFFQGTLPIAYWCGNQDDFDV